MTNFDSAHDCDGSMTIDYHFDEEGDLIPHMNDSVWYVLLLVVSVVKFLVSWLDWSVGEKKEKEY